MGMSYTVAGEAGLTLDAVGNGYDAKCPKCGTTNHLRMSKPLPEDNYVDVDKVNMSCSGKLVEDGEEIPCDYKVVAGQLVGTY